MSAPDDYGKAGKGIGQLIGGALGAPFGTAGASYGSALFGAARPTYSTLGGTMRRHSAMPWLLIVLLVAATASACDNTRPSVRVLDWGVLDKETNMETDIPAGGSLVIDASHPYIVTLRVKEPDGIRSMSVWGQGSFQCSTDPSVNGGAVWDAPHALPAGLPRTDTTLPGTSTYQSFQQTDQFTYFAIYCGKHTYQGPPGPQDYFATSGTLQLVGAETSLAGTETRATLNLNP